MKKHWMRIIAISIVVSVTQPTNVSGAAPAQSEFIQWTNGFNKLSFGLSGDHTEIQRYLPWYRYEDPAKFPFVSSQVPLSIRIPTAILLDFSKSNCINIPVKIRREVPITVATDSSNILSIDFYPFQSSITSKLNAFELTPVASFGPTNWVNNAEVVEVQLPACKETFVVPGKSSLGPYLSVSLVYKYSRDLSAVRGDTSKCKEITFDKCVFIQRLIMPVELLSDKSRIAELPLLYENSIREIQDFLDTNPCFPNGVGDRLLSPISCANASKNLEILKSELLAIKQPIA